MLTRTQIARATAAALRGADLAALPAVLGFDGFVDDIIEVVDKRHAHDRYDRLSTLALFGRKVSAAAGHSCNVELVVTRQKLGGNGPIMGNALALLGVPTTYIGAVGDGAGGAAAGGAAGGIHPVFAEFAARARLIAITPPAHTHALEFLDGKLMLGDLGPLAHVTWRRLLEVVPLDRLIALVDAAALVGAVNWTMLPHLTDIWMHIGAEVFPKVSARPRRMFVDLADPEKRSAADLRAALAVLKGLNRQIPVTLGLNLSEAHQVTGALGLAGTGEGMVRELAVEIRRGLELDTVVIHPREGAAAATADASADFAGPFVQNPKISTGAGDHFNAGFAAAQLLKLPLENALCLATATSGYYVRNAASPTAAQLAEFLENLPDPQ